MPELNFYTLPPYSLYTKKLVGNNTQEQDSAVLMVHGSAHTGHCYEYSPDGREGMGNYFVQKGFDVYVVDWPGMGRSGFVPEEKINGSFFAYALANLIQSINRKVIVICHSMSAPIVWKLPELLDKNYISRIIALAPGEMGNIQEKAEYKTKTENVYEINFGPITYELEVPGFLPPSDEFVKRKLIGESKQFPEDHLEDYKATLQPTNTKLVWERFNVDGSQLKITNIEKFKEIKILTITGTNDADHPKEKDAEIVNYFTSRNIDCTHCFLGDFDIKGNGHMLMIEKNNYEIFNKILDWIDKN